MLVLYTSNASPWNTVKQNCGGQQALLYIVRAPPFVKRAVFNNYWRSGPTSGAIDWKWICFALVALAQAPQGLYWQPLLMVVH
jgi:hypothetical protein